MGYDNTSLSTDVPEYPSTSDDPVRALYDGDISSGILQKFAAYYRSNLWNPVDMSSDSYFCVRQNSGEYLFYVGDIESNGKINSCKLVRYRQVSAGGYNTAFEWSVSTLGSGNVDTGGYSGYIYSSYPAYPSNPYMDEYIDKAYASFFSCAILILVSVCALGSAIRRFFNAKS